MYRAPDPGLWQGRSDEGHAAGDARRWHQALRTLTPGDAPGRCLLGFACDAGVRRNQGRVGAAQGPLALRRALGNLAWHGGETPLYDAGDVCCADDGLEAAQAEYAARLAGLLRAGHRVLGLGGGHEIAWAAYQGLSTGLPAPALAGLGILNFDAHLDLRPLPLEDGVARGNSGTPFRQIATARAAAGLEFRYLCVGASRAANTDALLADAERLGAGIAWDTDCDQRGHDGTAARIADFVRGSAALYLTLCLDVLPAAVAPGVSAPAALGLAPATLVGLLRTALSTAAARRIPVLADLAEFAPPLDPDGRTARIAARLAFELCTDPA